MVGHLFAASLKRQDLGRQVLVHERAEVHDLCRELLGVLAEHARVAVLQMRGAACAQRHDEVAVLCERGHVLARHAFCGLRLAKHHKRQAAACLLHRERHLDAACGEHIQCRENMFGVDEVLRASGEERHLEAWRRYVRLHDGPHFAERLRRERGQRLESLFPEQGHRQMAHEAVIARNRLLRKSHELQERMEEASVAHGQRCNARRRGRTVLAREASAYLLYERGQVYAARANLLARAASHAVLAQLLRDLPVVEEVGEHKADRADVHVAHAVPANEAEAPGFP